MNPSTDEQSGLDGGQRERETNALLDSLILKQLPWQESPFCVLCAYESEISFSLY